MAIRVVISPQTTAVDTERISISEAMVPVTFQTTGLGSGEEIAFQVTAQSVSAPTDWEDAVQGGGDIVLSIDQNSQRIASPCIIRLSKPSTAAAVGVMMIDRYAASV